MRFESVGVDINFLLGKLASENGRWEMGLSPVLFGVRVRASVAGSHWASVDYCAGPDLAFAGEILLALVKIFETWPESISENEVYDRLPKWKARPINRDGCWTALQAMAAEAERQVAA